MNHLLRFCILLYGVSCTLAYAMTVVENTNIAWTVASYECSNPAFCAALGEAAADKFDYRGTIFQDLIADDYTSGFFEGTQTTLSAYNYHLDEGSEWYIVNPGDIFSEENIFQNKFAHLINPSGPGGTFGSITLVPNEVIYLGIASSTTNNYGERNIFGWVRLENSAPAGYLYHRLRVAESAVAYDSKGIIVGTNIGIPEPTSLVLACGTILAAAMTRRFD